MSAPEVVSTDGDTSISPRAGGAIGSVFLKYVWVLLIHDQHDREARVWEEGAVEVLSECCHLSFESLSHSQDLCTTEARRARTVILLALLSGWPSLSRAAS